MTLEERIEALEKLGEALKTYPEWESVARKSVFHNPWFTIETVNESKEAICQHYLDGSNLRQWISKYKLEDKSAKTVGLILAGNIPWVGIHDIISVFLSGNKAQIKLSEKDTVLNKFLLALLEEIDPRTKVYFHLVDRLENYDAVIATGSNTTGRYFEKYFSQVPSIIRKNRHGVAVVRKETSDADIKLLGRDIFSYFGLGCRNVSKIYLEEGLKVDKVFDQLNDFAFVKNHNKYANNYDYNYALFLMNDKKFFTNEFLIMKPDHQISSRIASVHYEHYSELQTLESHLIAASEEIQCVVSDNNFNELKVVPFGESQSPQLWDYADGIDTMDFLSKI